MQFDIATLHGIPLYDGDVEAREGKPEAVLTQRNRIQASDGLLLATPEYNNGIPRSAIANRGMPIFLVGGKCSPQSCAKSVSVLGHLLYEGAA